MPPFFLASSVIALLVALFNALLAGYVLASGWSDARKRLFAVGPVGVTLFALSWFVLLIDPDTRDPVSATASFAALLAVSGFAGDALIDLGPSRARRWLVLVLLLGGMGLTGAAVFVASATRFPLAPHAAPGARAGHGGLHWWRAPVALPQRERGHPAALAARGRRGHRLAARVRHPRGLELLSGSVSSAAVILCTILAAEMMTLSYILHDRVDVRPPVTRAVTHALLAIASAFTVIAVLRALGYSVDLGQVAITVGVALLASLLFVGLGDPLSRWLEFLLFPKQARLTGLLSASRSESAALRSRLERAERLAIAGELAASVAHEIKNPLAALRGYAELLTDYRAHVASEQRERFEKAVRIIREESDRIDSKVQELLSLGRAPKGRWRESRWTCPASPWRRWRWPRARWTFPPSPRGSTRR